MGAASQPRGPGRENNRPRAWLEDSSDPRRLEGVSAGSAGRLQVRPRLSPNHCSDRASSRRLALRVSRPSGCCRLRKALSRPPLEVVGGGGGGGGAYRCTGGITGGGMLGGGTPVHVPPRLALLYELNMSAPHGGAQNAESSMPRKLPMLGAVPVYPPLPPAGPFATAAASLLNFSTRLLMCAVIASRAVSTSPG